MRRRELRALGSRPRACGAFALRARQETPYGGKVRSVRPKSRGSTPASIDEYLAGVSARFRGLLRALRRTIKVAAPQATESITYGIPTFKHDGQRLTYFSAATSHCAIHMVGKAHLAEAARLGFGIGRGSIRFTPEHPLPERLVTRIVKARLAEISRRSSLRRRTSG
jgi:uncharacterized protein YdhG (YjbR/CyaY superfamily)